MAIRLPRYGALDYNDVGQTGATSIAGTVAKTFQLPQDTDNVLLKLTASVIAGGVDATFQTTDDGGVTYYDVGRTSIVSNANGAAAQWLSMPVNGIGYRSAVQGQNSVAGATNTAVVLNTIGAASSLGQSQMSGLPILSQQGRVLLRYTAAVSGTDLARVQVITNSQSATA